MAAPAPGAGLFVLVGEGQVELEPELRLGELDVSARMAALAVESLRYRLPEVRARHAVSEKVPEDALSILDYASAHAQHVARALDMPQGELKRCLEWLASVQRCMLRGVYADFSRQRAPEGASALEALTTGSALVMAAAPVGSLTWRNHLLIRAHVRATRVGAPIPAPPTPPPPWVRERALRARHTGGEHTSARASSAGAARTPPLGAAGLTPARKGSGGPSYYFGYVPPAAANAAPPVRAAPTRSPEAAEAEWASAQRPIGLWLMQCARLLAPAAAGQQPLLAAAGAAAARAAAPTTGALAPAPRAPVPAAGGAPAEQIDPRLYLGRDQIDPRLHHERDLGAPTDLAVAVAFFADGAAKSRDSASTVPNAPPPPPPPPRRAAAALSVRSDAPGIGQCAPVRAREARAAIKAMVGAAAAIPAASLARAEAAGGGAHEADRLLLGSAPQPPLGAPPSRAQVERARRVAAVVQQARTMAAGLTAEAERRQSALEGLRARAWVLADAAKLRLSRAMDDKAWAAAAVAAESAEATHALARTFDSLCDSLCEGASTRARPAAEAAAGAEGHEPGPCAQHAPSSVPLTPPPTAPHAPTPATSTATTGAAAPPSARPPAPPLPSGALASSREELPLLPAHAIVRAALLGSGGGAAAAAGGGVRIRSVLSLPRGRGAGRARAEAAPPAAERPRARPGAAGVPHDGLERIARAAAEAARGLDALLSAALAHARADADTGLLSPHWPGEGSAKGGSSALRLGLAAQATHTDGSHDAPGAPPSPLVPAGDAVRLGLAAQATHTDGAYDAPGAPPPPPAASSPLVPAGDGSTAPPNAPPPPPPAEPAEGADDDGWWVVDAWGAVALAVSQRAPGGGAEEPSRTTLLLLLPEPVAEVMRAQAGPARREETAQAMAGGAPPEPPAAQPPSRDSAAAPLAGAPAGEPSAGGACWYGCLPRERTLALLDALFEAELELAVSRSYESPRAAFPPASGSAARDGSLAGGGVSGTPQGGRGLSMEQHEMLLRAMTGGRAWTTGEGTSMRERERALELATPVWRQSS